MIKKCSYCRKRMFGSGTRCKKCRKKFNNYKVSRTDRLILNRICCDCAKDPIDRSLSIRRCAKCFNNNKNYVRKNYEKS